MSTFKVSVEAISEVLAHPNADRLELARLEGMAFQFVVGKGSYSVGDKVVYFPVDSLIPPPLQEKLGLVGRLSGAEKSRVKTVKLRGQISQGVVGSAELFPAFEPGADVSEHLGVVKYEPATVATGDADLRPLPDGVPEYDIEGADRFSAVAESLMDVVVVVTEKVEGSNFSVTYFPDGDRVEVCSKRRSIIEWPTRPHRFWNAARRHELPEFAKEISARYGDVQVTVRGEFAGPGCQKNIYNLKEHEVFVFDIMVNHVYMSPGVMRLACIRDGKTVAPVLFSGGTLRQFLEGRSIQAASDGRSLVGCKPRREGIVIKPEHEARHNEIGRLILKQRSPAYLAKSEL